jgi:HAD superfamily hydrolase (TIGR01450 family)
VPAKGAVDLTGVRGFVFDVDGTLVHRDRDGHARPQPGAVDVLARIRETGRPLVLFTNGSHVGAQAIARGLREDGLPIGDDEVLTPVESAITYLRRYHRDQPALLFCSEVIRERIAAAGVPIAGDHDRPGVVFVAHVNEAPLDRIERAAHAVADGAALLTGSYVRAYAGANGPIISRGAMVSAAIGKGGGARPKIVGKPSRAAVAELRTHLRIPTHELAVIGDDLGMDVALGKMGGARTVLVRSGISGAIDVGRLPERLRPAAVVDGVVDLLEWI